MPIVAIIGAGELGGTIAHTLAVKAQITEIRPIDDLASLAPGKALDIRQYRSPRTIRYTVMAGLDPCLAAALGLMTCPSRQ
jgi:malate/lactate dehydrogenase